jgi:hypothetical protein
LPHLPANAAVRGVPPGDSATAPRADLAGFVDLSDTVDLTQTDMPRPNDGDDGRPKHHIASHDALSAEDMDWPVQIAAAHLQPHGDMPELLKLHEIRSVVQELPVLTEAIGAAELPDIGAVVARANAALPRAGHAGRGGAMPAEGQMSEPAPSRKTATRSRLMRMKEKGLFKNE